MDILNFISWIAGKKRIVTTAPDDALVPIGIRTETRDDKYTTVAIKKSDLISSGFKYEIGQYVADEGGVIAHRWLSDVALGSPISGSFENYLVISIVDQSTGQAWSNVTSTLIGSTAQSTWDGLSNSNAIVGQVGFTNGAAKTCLDLVSLGKDDWYLPSLDEANLILQNRFNIVKTFQNIVGASVFSDFWTSTEFDAGKAYYFKQSSVYFLTGNKSQSSPVRAVRKFSLPI